MCQDLEDGLNAITADMEHSADRHGITVSSSNVESQQDLCASVEPVLPVGVFGEPRS